MAVSEDRKDLIMDYINTSWKRYTQAPSIREIIDHLDIGDSTSYVATALQELAEDGRLFLVGEAGEARRATPAWVVRAVRSATVERR